MTRASAEHQKSLLAVQALDTHLAKLAHERRSLPVHARIQSLETDAASAERERIETATRRADLGRELTRIESDVEQIHTRAQRHRDRLVAGASARDAQAIEHELGLLSGRTSELEDLQLEQMEQIDQADERIEEIAQRIEEIARDLAATRSERDAEYERIDSEVSSLQGERGALVSALPEDLVELYNEVRESTGGLGAVALHGTRTEGVSIDFSLSELDSIRSAAPDEVLTSEERGYILVRL